VVWAADCGTLLMRGQAGRGPGSGRVGAVVRAATAELGGADTDGVLGWKP
jgi:hypothetical protein